jgi:hypothetical protein
LLFFKDAQGTPANQLSSRVEIKPATADNAKIEATTTVAVGTIV